MDFAFMDQDWIDTIKENMLSVIPSVFLKDGRISLRNEHNKKAMFEAVCHHACLDPKAEDVKTAYAQLLEDKPSETTKAD